MFVVLDVVVGIKDTMTPLKRRCCPLIFCLCVQPKKKKKPKPQPEAPVEPAPPQATPPVAGKDEMNGFHANGSAMDGESLDSLSEQLDSASLDAAELDSEPASSETTGNRSCDKPDFILTVSAFLSGWSSLLPSCSAQLAHIGWLIEKEVPLVDYCSHIYCLQFKMFFLTTKQTRYLFVQVVVVILAGSQTTGCSFNTYRKRTLSCSAGSISLAL